MGVEKHISDLSQRFLDVLQYKRYSAYKLEREVEEITASKVGHIKSGRNQPSDEVLNALLKKFPDIDKVWLLTGEGEMLNAKSSKTSMVLSDLTPLKGYSTTPTKNTDSRGVPYYDIDFMGGFDLVFNDQSIQPNFYIDFLPFNDCDCWINVSGKSMGPLIAHGDIVGLKKVDNWQRFLLEGEIYAVITDNGFRTIKMIGAGPDKESYTLIPYNKSEEYKPQVIPKEVITHVFRVKGNIKKFF